MEILGKFHLNWFLRTAFILRGKTCYRVGYVRQSNPYLLLLMKILQITTKETVSLDVGLVFSDRNPFVC